METTALQVAPRHDVQPRRDEPRNRTNDVFELRPAIDVYESADALRIVADVPGVEPASAEVWVEGRQLRIACARSASGGRQARYRATLRLPDTVDPESLDARLGQGVLEITVGKRASARPRRIEVRAARAEG